MKILQKYIESKKLTQSDFAKLLGVSQATVSRYLEGVVIPSAKIMAEIVKITNGAVTPNDFYGITEPVQKNVSEDSSYKQITENVGATKC